MPTFVKIVAAVLGSLGFSAMFNLQGRELLYVCLGGLITWLVYLIIYTFTPNDCFCALIASCFTTIYAEFIAFRRQTPVTLYLVTSAVPLIPGAGLYQTFSQIVQSNFELAATEGFHTLLFAASMSAGITLSSLAYHIIRRRLEQRRLFSK